MNWIDLLRELLCRLYEEWGGDCQNLGADPKAWIGTVAEEYESAGAPTGLGVPNLLGELETHLDLEDNSLTGDDSNRVRKVIEAIRGDLGGGA